jgi:pantothenate synthetase
MSSRNRYLDANQRKTALVLSRSLARVQELFAQGERDAQNLITAGKLLFGGELDVRLDYFEIVDPETLDAISTLRDPALVAVAAFVGSTRLIDNRLLQI